MKIGIVAYGAAWVLTIWFLTGCSFSVDIGYHGRTGVDNRTQSALVTTKESELGNVRTTASTRY